MTNFLTEISNNAFILASLYMTVECRRWYKKYGKEWQYMLFLVGITLIFISVAVRVGWWSPALKFAEVGETYHPFFVEWKWLPTFLSSVGFVTGAVLLVGFVEGESKRTMLSWAAAIYGAAFIIGLL
jgi:hypothetical protein